MSKTTYICPKCGKPGYPDTLTRRNTKGEIIRKELTCAHVDPDRKTPSGRPHLKRCKLGNVTSPEKLGLTFLKE